MQTSVQHGLPKTTNPLTIQSKLQKIDPKSIKCQQKSIKSQSESIREKGRFQDPPKVAPAYAFFGPFGATWPILGAILDRAGFKRGPKIMIFGIILEK